MNRIAIDEEMVLAPGGRIGLDRGMRAFMIDAGQVIGRDTALIFDVSDDTTAMANGCIFYNILGGVGLGVQRLRHPLQGREKQTRDKSQVAPLDITQL